MPERFAIYFAPEAASPLSRTASQWLGRDAAGEVPPAAGGTGIDPLRLRAVTRSARRYGFHATLKAPMALAPGTDRGQLEAAMAVFARDHAALPVGGARLALLDGFLALIPVHQTATLTAFAQHVVAAFELFRAPLSAADRAARIERGRLTPRQVELLDEFGYPHVAEEFRFHMTLTDRLAAAERATIVAAAERWFAPVMPDALSLDRLSLFHEPEAGAPFLHVADFPLSRLTKV